jgi:hypothetical protein
MSVGRLIVGVLLVFSLCGCETLPLTTRTVEAARGETTIHPQPEMYLLTPLTFPADLIYYMLMHWHINNIEVH